MRTSRLARRLLAGASGLGLFAAGMWAAGFGAAAAGAQERRALPGFDRVVILSHVNDPDRTPLFPGDPRFRIHTAFTIADDGFFLEVVREGMHTGTHYSAPCHFHAGAACMPDLSGSDLVLPAAVIDVRDRVADDPDYVVTIADLQAWEDEHGAAPRGRRGPAVHGLLELLGRRRRRRGAQLLQLRQRPPRLPSARLLAERGPVADRDRRPRTHGRPRDGHVRPGSVVGRVLHADVADVARPSRHDREPHASRRAPAARRLGGAREPAQRERQRRAGDGVRLPPVSGFDPARRQTRAPAHRTARAGAPSRASGGA